jgi:hypothetical protein
LASLAILVKIMKNYKYIRKYYFLTPTNKKKHRKKSTEKKKEKLSDEK